jgi:hypothetical protein
VQVEFTIYPGRAPSVMLTLTEGDRPIPDHRAVTRLIVYVGSTKYDSQATPELFDLSHIDHVRFNLAAAFPALPTGKYSCLMIVYDAGEWTLGYPWPEKFLVNIRVEPN